MLVFLKLGGSLITDKRKAETPRLDVIARLAQEIAAAQQDDPALRLVIGHGSGSFGHIYGRKYGTRDG
ncbi:MAG: uridylate kinase, partial [Caldilinea sp.]